MEAMVTKAIIFDMDGLMIDSERVTYEGYQIICKKYGYEMDYSFYETLLGFPMAVIRERFLEHFDEHFPMETIIDEVHSYMAIRFEKEGIPMKPGLMEILEFAKKQGYGAAVATSSDRNRVDTILVQAGIEGYFQGVVCGDEVKNGKPNPEVFIKCCEKLAVSPQEAWVIEDSQMGILAASRAGIRCICVPDLKQPEKEYRDLAYDVVDTLTDAIAVIRAYEGEKP